MRRGFSLVPAAAAALVLASGSHAMTLSTGGSNAGSRTAFQIVVVDRLTQHDLRALAARGAVGLLVPGAGATTSRSYASAALVQGADVNAYVAQAGAGDLRLPVEPASAVLRDDDVIVVTLPQGGPQPNDRRYPMAVVGGGFHGLLTSPTTRIAGLVSIADIAPTALGRAHRALHSVATDNALGALAQLDRQIHANNRLKLPTLVIIAIGLLLAAVLRPRAALPAILGALVASIVAGAAHVSSEPWLVTIMVAGLVGGGLALERLCNDDDRLLLAIVAVLLLYTVLLVAHPDWVAVTPLGPTQDSRFWGIGNQLETLLIAPVVAGATLAARRFGTIGFGPFAVLALVLVTDNRLGSDGGGAIVFGTALAFVGARTLRTGVRGFVTLLLLAATAVLTIVMLNLQTPGPDHLRSAFSHGLGGVADVVANRVPLAYLPALHHWPVLLPVGLLFLAAAVYAMRAADAQSRDLVLAALLGVATSLAVNDSAAYELAGGVAVVAALARLQLTGVEWRMGVVARRSLASDEAAG
jgi:hypothetical protein